MGGQAPRGLRLRPWCPAPRGGADRAVNKDASSPAVELHGIQKRFGARVILDAIDLVVARGEILVLVGPSGSGKSTLLKIVSGIEKPDAGRVWLGGRDCTDLPPYRRAVHTVFQNYALFPHLDVLGNVMFPLVVAGRPRAECRQRALEALGWVQMEHHARRAVETLSGGERQRVALARALVDAPECLLLDEPLSALDPHLRGQTLELLKGLQRRLGTTFLFVTHDREEALRVGHRIGVLNRGHLEQIGRPEEVYRRPRTAFVASFLGRINWLAGTGYARPGRQGVEVAQAWIPCPDQPALPAGPVLVGVRPEDLQIGPSGWLSARVVERTFLGDVVQWHLVLADGTTLLADQRPPVGDWRVGQSVQLHWDPATMHVFARQADEPLPPLALATRGEENLGEEAPLADRLLQGGPP